MAFTFEGDDNLITVQFGEHRISLIPREEGSTINTVRLLAQKQKRAQLASDRIDQLTEKAKNASSTEEYQKHSSEIQALSGEPDGAALMVDMILAAAKGWKDVYDDKAAEAAGRTLEFSRENIERFPLKGLVKMVEAITRHLGLTDEPSGEAEGNLHEQSLQKDKAPGSSLTGTQTSRPTAQ